MIRFKGRKYATNGPTGSYAASQSVRRETGEAFDGLNTLKGGGRFSRSGTGGFSRDSINSPKLAEAFWGQVEMLAFLLKRTRLEASTEGFDDMLTGVNNSVASLLNLKKREDAGGAVWSVPMRPRGTVLRGVDSLPPPSDPRCAIEASPGFKTTRTALLAFRSAASSLAGRAGESYDQIFDTMAQLVQAGEALLEEKKDRVGALLVSSSGSKPDLKLRRDE